MDTNENEAGRDDLERLKGLRRDVGVLLVVVGVGGLLLPGPVGTPFLLAGGVVLWPRAFERLELSFARKFPTTHRRTTKQLNRFLDDLERRYPTRGDASSHDRPSSV